MSRSVISTDDAPEAIGPYSQAVLVDGWLYTAGQIGLDPATGELVPGGVEAEARRALANLRAVLEAAGLGFGDAVKTTVYLADMDDYAAVNEIYGEHFTAPYPARSAVEAATLPRDAGVEVELVARGAG